MDAPSGTSDATDLDIVARRLAGSAGVRWDGLNDYPGYTKNYWREQARSIIAEITPHAVFQEPRGNRWDD